MNEQWLPVVGFEGKYEVSDLGRVRSLDRVDSGGQRRVGRLLRIACTSEGRAIVTLYGGHGYSKNGMVQRLVLEAFVGPCPHGMEACHYPNRDPMDNRLENLRWDTHRANKADQREHDTLPMGESHGCAKLTESDVHRIFDLRRSGLTQQRIGDMMGVDRTMVSLILRGRNWAHLGLSL